MPAAFSKEQVISNIESMFEATPYSFVSFVEPYVNSRSKVVVQCSKHGKWQVAIRHLTTLASSCPDCGNESISKKKSEKIETVLLKIQKKCQTDQYVFKGFYGEYRNRKSKIIVCCPKHGDYTVNINNFIDNDRKCPSCKCTGFNVSKPGYLYALRSTCGCFVKVGITNNIASRVSILRRSTPFEFETVETLFFDNGKEALLWENLFHRTFSSADFKGFDGCTEWLRWDNTIQSWFRFLK